MREMNRYLEQWEMDVSGVHRRLILSPTRLERERWHTVWLLACGVRESGPKIFFADGAHFWADAELRGKWVLKGKPALMHSNQPTSPRRGEKTDYYSAVCLETREVEWMGTATRGLRLPS